MTEAAEAGASMRGRCSEKKEMRVFVRETVPLRADSARARGLSGQTKSHGVCFLVFTLSAKETTKMSSKTEGSKRKKVDRANEEQSKKKKQQQQQNETEELEGDSSEEQNESESESRSSARDDGDDFDGARCGKCWEMISEEYEDGSHRCHPKDSNLRIRITRDVRELVESMIELDTYEESHLRWCLRQLSHRHNLWKNN